MSDELDRIARAIIDAKLHLYRARVSEHWVLDPECRPDQRTRVRP